MDFSLFADAETADRMSWTLDVDQLKRVMRQNPNSTGEIREDVAQHSWHLAISVVMWAPVAVEKVDVNRACLLATVHDFPELFVGDHSVYSSHEASRSQREDGAMRRFRREASDLSEVIFLAWRDFEYENGPEARIVLALDIVLPVLLNYSNLANSSWTSGETRITEDMVRRRLQMVHRVLPALANAAGQLVEDAAQRGSFGAR